MASRSTSRQRFVDAAADLFPVQGYHATGVNQLVAAGGGPKGSFYFHFPGGKEQLAAEAVAQSGRQLYDVLAAALAGGDIDAVFDVLAGMLEDSDFRRGCPIATIALDAAGDSPLIREACAAGLSSWQSLIEEFLLARGLEPARARRLSTVTLAMIEGGLLLAKTQRDTAPLRAVADQLKEMC